MHEPSNREIFNQAGIPIILTWLLIPLSFFLPIVDSTTPPYFDLSQETMNLVYWVSESGGKFGAPIIAMLALFVLINRDGIGSTQKIKEASIIILTASVFAGGGASINEHFIKEKLEIPRPNISWLAGEGGIGALGMSAEHFYATGDKEARRVYLTSALQQGSQSDSRPIHLTPLIEAHWIEETGYSFPSGHAFSAMFFATFLLLIGTTYITSRRLWALYLLLPWALAVCYSRPILRVHTPTDISIGGLQGLLIGLLAWAIARALIRRMS